MRSRLINQHQLDADQVRQFDLGQLSTAALASKMSARW